MRPTIRRSLLLALITSFVWAPPNAFAQKPTARAADVAGRAPAAKKLLSTVGHWFADVDGSMFYFQFRPNGSYTYTHIDVDKVTRAQHAGAFDVRVTRFADDRWPGVAAPPTDARKNKSFELLLKPAVVEVTSSDPQGLPDDRPGEYRLSFTLAAEGTTDAPTVTILAATLPPDSAFGRLTFTPGP